MKLKHLIAWIIYFSLLASLILLMGCANPELTRKITAWQRTYPNRTGDCQIHAMRAYAMYQRLGVPVRFCPGKWKGERHSWVEYYSKGKWLVDDKSLGHKGWEREAYKHYEWSE